MTWFCKSGFDGDRRGVAAVEFALIAPPLALLVFGAIQYGLYFGTANSLQQLTNDAARVSLAGLGEKERDALVDAHVHERGESYGFLVTDRIQADVEEGGDVIVVMVNLIVKFPLVMRLWNTRTGNIRRHQHRKITTAPRSSMARMTRKSQTTTTTTTTTMIRPVETVCAAAATTTKKEF